MRKVIKGNHAVSEGVRLCRVKVISAYPITPQTTIVESLSEMCAGGELDAQFIKVESEHSAMAAVIGSSSAGVRSFTATSSHGLLYMHEGLHWAAGARLPIVLANVNRAVGTPWNIWADQTDSLSQRDTGWLQIYSESNQEALDNVLLAFRLAETVSMPVMLSFDAFYLSHTSEVVDVPSAAKVDDFLPAYAPQFRLDVNDPHTFGSLFSPDNYYEQRYVMHHSATSALGHFDEIGREFERIFDRPYAPAEAYRTDDAEIILVTAGTLSSVARLAVDACRSNGIKVGLMKIRLFRPVPTQLWRTILGSAAKIAVVDRALIAGLGGVFASEVQAALYALARRPLVFPVIAGIGGRDVTPQDMGAIIARVSKADTCDGAPLFWGLKQPQTVVDSEPGTAPPGESYAKDL